MGSILNVKTLKTGVSKVSALKGAAFESRGFQGIEALNVSALNGQHFERKDS